MRKRLITITDHPDDVGFARGAAQALGSELVLRGTLEEALPLLDPSRHDPVLCEFQPGEEFDEKLVFLMRQCGRENVHVIIPRENLGLTIGNLRSDPIGHLILRKYDDPAKNGRRYSEVLRAAAGERTLVIGAFVSPEAQSFNAVLKDPSEKEGMIESASDHLHHVGLPPRIIQTMSNVVDELLMNAMYDAPAERKRLGDLPDAQQEEPGLPELRIVADRSSIAVTVTDSMGSLDHAQVLQHISQTYSRKLTVQRPDCEYSGAGLGLAILLRSGGSLFFHTQPQKRTEVTAIYRISERFSNFRNQFQFISIRFGAIPATRTSR